jgi:hypothetical protein
MTIWPRGRAARFCALALGFAALIVLYFAVLAGSAYAGTSDVSSPPETAGADQTALPFGGQTAAPPTQVGSEPAPAPAATPGQEATTDQDAASDASAAQEDAHNIVVSVRVDSPGDDGEITQTNVVAVVSDGSNDSSTNQSGSAGAEGAGAGQGASTGQAASSTATATQDGAKNIVVIVRINSPGDDGPISQTNTAVAASNASNTSATAQGAAVAQDNGNTAGTTGGNGAEATGSSRDEPAPVGPPAEQQQSSQPPASAPAGAPPSRFIDLPAPARPAAAVPAGGKAKAHRSTSRPGGRAQVEGPAPGPASAGESSTLAGTHTGQAAAEAGRTSRPQAVRPEARQATRAAAATRPHPERSVRGVGRRAADLLLDSLTPRRGVPTGESSEDVSSAVLLTLIAVLGAALVFAGSTYLPSRRRLLHPRTWWRR